MLDEQLALSACVISQKARVAKSCFHASTALTFSPFECHKRTWLMKTITGTYFAKPSQAKPSQAKPSQAKPSSDWQACAAPVKQELGLAEGAWQGQALNVHSLPQNYCVTLLPSRLRAAV